MPGTVSPLPCTLARFPELQGDEAADAETGVPGAQSEQRFDPFPNRAQVVLGHGHAPSFLVAPAQKNQAPEV